jgi:hypothetical protein
MILCCPDRTRSKPIRHATRHLTEAGATILGVIVNDVDMSSGSAFLPTSRSYGYGYGGGYGGYGSYGYRSYGAYRPRGGKSQAKPGDAKAEPGKKPDEASKPEASAASSGGKSEGGHGRSHGPSVSMDIADDD